MNSKQLKAQRRRIRQKQKKFSLKNTGNPVKIDEKTVQLSCSTSIWLNKRVQFEQMSLDSHGISLKTFRGTIVKVDLASEDPNDPVVTIVEDEEDKTTAKSKRIEALLGEHFTDTIVSKPSELINFQLLEN